MDFYEVEISEGGIHSIFGFKKLAIFGHKFIEKFIFNKGLHKKKNIPSKS